MYRWHQVVVSAWERCPHWESWLYFRYNPNNISSGTLILTWPFTFNTTFVFWSLATLIAFEKLTCRCIFQISIQTMRLPIQIKWINLYINRFAEVLLAQCLTTVARVRFRLCAVTYKVTCEKSVVHFDSTKLRRFTPGTLVFSCRVTLNPWGRSLTFPLERTA